MEPSPGTLPPPPAASVPISWPCYLVRPNASVQPQTEGMPMRAATYHTLAALFLLAPAARADDWPQWRGRDRDGHAHGARLPKTWPDRPPKPLWTAKVGEG